MAYYIIFLEPTVEKKNAYHWQSVFFVIKEVCTYNFCVVNNLATMLYFLLDSKSIKTIYCVLQFKRKTTKRGAGLISRKGWISLDIREEIDVTIFLLFLHRSHPRWLPSPSHILCFLLKRRSVLVLFKIFQTV